MGRIIKTISIIVPILITELVTENQWTERSKSLILFLCSKPHGACPAAHLLLGDVSEKDALYWCRKQAIHELANSQYIWVLAMKCLDVLAYVLFLSTTPTVTSLRTSAPAWRRFCGNLIAINYRRPCVHGWIPASFLPSVQYVNIFDL